MKAACRNQFTLEGGPAVPRRRKNFAQRIADPALHRLQAAKIDRGATFDDHARDVGRTLDHEVLNITFGLPHSSRGDSSPRSLRARRVLGNDDMNNGNINRIDIAKSRRVGREEGRFSEPWFQRCRGIFLTPALRMSSCPRRSSGGEFALQASEDPGV
jgi:hypothetical protein